jgi:hypothetical protein
VPKAAAKALNGTKAASASPPPPSPVLASKKLKKKPPTGPKTAPKSITRVSGRGRKLSANTPTGSISEELAKARRQQRELMSKLRDQEKELQRLQDMKTGASSTKSFSQRLKEEAGRVEELTKKLKRMEVLAQEQKKEMLAAGHKRFENAKSTLADLDPKVGLLEAQYAAQIIELSAIATTRTLEVALLARSNAAMDEGTKALESAVRVGESPVGGISRRNSSVAAVSRVLQRRAARLKTSVSEMKQEVRRAKERLGRVKKHTDARRAAYSSAASTDIAALTTALESARTARKAAAAESQKDLESLRTALERARQRAIEESEKDMAEMRRRVESKRAELEKQAEAMRTKLATAKRKLARSSARRVLFAKEFELLKLALDESRTEHEDHMESLLDSSSKIDQNLEGRRARTRAEREEALLLMESELRSSLENRWRETLARVKADGMRQLEEAEEVARQQCSDLATSISDGLHEDYSKRLTELDGERQKRQRHTTVLAAQIESLSEATKEASEDLLQRRSSLENRSSRKVEEKETRIRQYKELQEQLKEIWETRRVPLSERVDFLIKADEVSDYSKEVVGMYELQINDLERSAPIFAAIKKRDELVVRMDTVRRYCRNPELAIQDGSAALLQRVGFTLPTPTPIREAELMAQAESRQFTRREKIRREAACHKLLQQWALCQRELVVATEELHRLLDQYAISSLDGHRFSQNGQGGAAYVVPHVSQDVASEPLALHKFSTVQVAAHRVGQF